MKNKKRIFIASIIILLIVLITLIINTLNLSFTGKSIFVQNSEITNSVQISDNQINISNNRIKLVFTNEDILDFKIKDLEDNNLLGNAQYHRYFGTILLKNGTKHEPINITLLEDNNYGLSYDIGAKVTLEILSYYDRIEFKLKNYSNLPENTSDIKIYNLYPINRAHYHKSDYDAIPERGIVLDALPLTPQTVCYNLAYLYCAAYSALDLENISSALLTTTKSEYLDALENFIDEKDLPKLVLEDGNWFRKSNYLREGYFFATLTEDNQYALLDYATRANFKQVLFNSPVKYAIYNESHSYQFSSDEEFYNSINRFRNEGMKIGIHTFLNAIRLSEGAIDLENPEWPLDQVFYNVNIGTLSKDLDTTETTISLNEDLEENTNFTYYWGDNIYSLVSNTFLIDNEIVFCRSYEGNNLTDCTRDYGGTLPANHFLGSKINILPFYYGGTSQNYFKIHPNNTELKQRSIDSLVDLQRKTGFNFIYNDGSSFVPSPEIESYVHYANTDIIGVIPYLEALDNLPFFQYGGSRYGFMAKYITIRSASDDGAIFKNKKYVKEHKIPRFNLYSPNTVLLEIGWWKFHGADFGNGKYDYDAVTFDDTHYAMTKSLVLNSSMGLQLSSNYDKHAKLLELFDLVGLYNTLIDLDITEEIVPNNIKEYLGNVDKEAELNNISGYNLVEKNVIKEYSNWQEGNYSFEFNNSFGEQGLKLQIRPRFDYYGFEDDRNLLIKDFSDSSNIEIIKNNDNVTCELSPEGILSMVHPSTLKGVAVCKLVISGDHDMTYKRGFGIRLIGDNKDEIIVLRAEGATSSSVSNRDYKFNVNFSNEQTLILGDPTNDERDTPEGMTDWGQNSKYRSWGKDFSDTGNIAIFVKSFNNGTTYNLEFKELKALYEKSNSTLVNPQIKIGAKTLTFPINLTANDIDPNILEYDGRTGDYTLYNSTYGLINHGTISKINLTTGINNITVTSDILDPSYSTRAEFMISSFDDEDGDLIPTNGNYNNSYYPCTGSNNFCDDNCPNTYNPSQLDSDNDGIGDACDPTPYPVNNNQNSPGSGTITSTNPSNTLSNETENETENNQINNGNSSLNQTQSLPEEENPSQSHSFGELIKKYWIYPMIVFVLGAIILFIILNHPSKNKKIKEDNLRKISEAKHFIYKIRNHGHSDSQIKKLFLDKNWKEDTIDKLLEESKTKQFY